jgi:hypothetical protein
LEWDSSTTYIGVYRFSQPQSYVISGLLHTVNVLHVARSGDYSTKFDSAMRSHVMCGEAGCNCSTSPADFAKYHDIVRLAVDVFL